MLHKPGQPLWHSKRVYWSSIYCTHSTVCFVIGFICFPPNTVNLPSQRQVSVFYTSLNLLYPAQNRCWVNVVELNWVKVLTSLHTIFPGISTAVLPHPYQEAPGAPTEQATVGAMDIVGEPEKKIWGKKIRSKSELKKAFKLIVSPPRLNPIWLTGCMRGCLLLPLHWKTS